MPLHLRPQGDLTTHKAFASKRGAQGGLISDCKRLQLSGVSRQKRRFEMLTLVKPEIETYSISKSVKESAILQELRLETDKTMEIPQMLCGPLEGAFLRMMVEIIEAERVLEIGTFTGYSTLWMADGLAGSGS